VEQAQPNWMARARAFPRQVGTGAIAEVKKRFKQLKNRYGPRYTKAMLAVIFLALLSPIPGTSLVGIALIVMIAEAHRAISKKDRCPKAIGKELVMSIDCDVILQWSATPAQLTSLGTALWRWCNRAAGDTGIYQYLDNQALADLIAGQFPAPSLTPRPAERPSAHFRVRDKAFSDRQATIDSLRRDIPAQGVEDIVVDGTSWNLVESKHPTCVTV
jgi:hypothetical protein